jgi:predicted proteasome-type protease
MMTTTNQAQPVADPVKAQDLLHRAADLMGERGKQYDQRSGERSMQATVTAFNAITGYHLTEADGFLLMAILKMVRDQSRETPHRDSIDDLVAYASLYGEARLHGEERRQVITRDEVWTWRSAEAKAAHDAAELLAQRVKAHQAAQEARYAGR